MFVDYKIFFFAILAGLALHLLADAGPKSWRGSAMINFYPLPFSLPPFFSMLYIFASAMFAAWASVSLMQ
jgi:hypothetical protein